LRPNGVLVRRQQKASIPQAKQLGSDLEKQILGYLEKGIQTSMEQGRSTEIISIK
jgi:hypothetical protein